MADIDGDLYVRSNGDADDKLQSKIVDFTTPTQGMEVDADGDAHVKAKLRDDSGAAFGVEANPVFTVVGEDPSPIVHDYDKASAIASDASSAHTFSPSNSTRVYGLELSASGYCKYEVAFGTTASEVETYVFFTEPSSRSKSVKFEKPISIAGGTESMVITKTNLDNKAQDLYSTINGQEF